MERMTYDNRCIKLRNMYLFLVGIIKDTDFSFSSPWEFGQGGSGVRNGTKRKSKYLNLKNQEIQRL